MSVDSNKTTRKPFLINKRFLPFADAVGDALPLSRLLRLSLFQITVGMAVVLLNGTLNRVMVIELGQAAWLVSLMVSLPLLFAPARAFIGFRSDHHRSVLGWRRVPYIWYGTLLQFGGLAIMPFALVVLSDPLMGPLWMGPAASALAFLLIGAGLHTSQTAGLALATDLASDKARPRVVSLLYVMLLIGMIVSSLVFSLLLEDFSQERLVSVIQGAAVITMVLNLIALWKQEARNPALTAKSKPRPAFARALREFSARERVTRLLLAVGLGSVGFSMQDILLEPYGGQILQLSVSATTGLTAILGLGMLAAFAYASKKLSDGGDPVRLAGYGALLGIAAFATVVIAAPFESALLFRVGTFGIGLGSGLFAVGTLTSAMELGKQDQTGLALGCWGAVQATATGLAIAAGGALRDGVTTLAQAGYLGPTLTGPVVGYSAVYYLEICVLFLALAVIGPLARRSEEPGKPLPAYSLGDLPQ
ncbi:MAG: BCD family MFS transporter [Pseudomonadota bacterium]